MVDGVLWLHNSIPLVYERSVHVFNAFELAMNRHILMAKVRVGCEVIHLKLVGPAGLEPATRGL